MDGEAIAQIVLSALTLPYVPFVIYFYSHRFFHPIAGVRMPLLVVAIDVLQYLYMTLFVALHLWDGMPCILNKILSIGITFNIFYLYTYRLVRLLFCFEITSNITKWTSQHMRHSRFLENWFTRNRWLMTEQNGIKMFIIANAVMLLTIFVSVLSYQAFREGKDCSADPSFNKVNLFLTAIFLLPLWILALFAYGVMRKHHDDAFAMKVESEVTLSLVVVGLLSFFVVTGLGVHPFLYTIPISFVAHSVFLTSTVWPAMLAQKEEKVERPQVVIKLVTVLKNPSGFEAFLEYLQHEFSSENLSFWREVEVYNQLDFSSSSNLDEIRGTAKKIYTFFVARDAAHCVNLPGGLQSGLRSFFDNLEEKQLSDFEHLFDAAQKEIYDLMSSDSFARFQRTAEYAEVKPQLEKSVTEAKSKTMKESEVEFTVADKIAGELELETIDYSAP